MLKLDVSLKIFFLTFSHIDTAWLYFNEDQVGRAISEKIKEGAIKREELFVTTKLAPVHWHVIKDTLVGCLKRLQLDYIGAVFLTWSGLLYRI